MCRAAILFADTEYIDEAVTSIVAVSQGIDEKRTDCLSGTCRYQPVVSNDDADYPFDYIVFFTFADLLRDHLGGIENKALPHYPLFLLPLL